MHADLKRMGPSDPDAGTLSNRVARALRTNSISKAAFLTCLAVILALALIIRVGAAQHYNAVAPQTDAADYDRHGVSIATGHGYPQAYKLTGGPGPTAFRPPLYPFVLGGTYVLSGTASETKRWLYARLVQALLGTVIVGLLALIARQLWGRFEALLAGAIAAVYPPMILAGTGLQTEPLFIVLLLAGVGCVLHYRCADHRLRWAVLAGICAGLATLDRSNGVVMILTLALGVWTLRPRLSLLALIPPIVVVAVAGLSILPWTIRNAVEFHAFVPVSTQSGFGLAGQFNDEAARNDALWLPPFAVPAYHHLFLSGVGEGEVKLGRKLTDAAADYAWAHPGQIIDAGWWNSLRLLNLSDPITIERRAALDLGQPQSLAQVSVYAFWLLGLLAIAVALVDRRIRFPKFMWLTPALLLVTVMFVSGLTRYRTPADPFLILLVASGAMAIARRPKMPGNEGGT